MISKIALTWQTCFEAVDEQHEIAIVVRPDGARWSWAAFDGAGDQIGSKLGFFTALAAQADAVAWWREQTEGGAG